MGVDGRLGPSKMRQLASMASLNNVVLAFADHPWVILITQDDEHWRLNRQTREVLLDSDPAHWGSCPGAKFVTESRPDKYT